MDCKQVEELLSDYIDHELSAEVHENVCNHLKKCLPCGMLKEQMEELMFSMGDMEEEVPFFLKNRLYYIPESDAQTAEEDNIIRMESSRHYLQWVAAVVATFLVFLNLIYFTNIFPPARRTLHQMRSGIEVMAVKAQGLLEKAKESTDVLLDKEDEEDIQENNTENLQKKQIRANGKQMNTG